MDHCLAYRVQLLKDFSLHALKDRYGECIESIPDTLPLSYLRRSV